MKKNFDENKNEPTRRRLGGVWIAVTALCAVLAISIIWSVWGGDNSQPESEPPASESSEPSSAPEPEPEPEPEPGPELVYEAFYPVGKLVSSSIPRKEYVAGDMELYIPRLEFSGPVYENVEVDTLKLGVGLFDQAQLPGYEEGGAHNSNTSIAGHRDIYGMEFYYIDTMEPGDYIYLTYGGDLYTYVTEEVFVTHDHDWDPIRVREYPSVTLQSCTPIGIANERIFVVGSLVDISKKTGFPEDSEVGLAGYSPAEKAAE